MGMRGGPGVGERVVQAGGGGWYGHAEGEAEGDQQCSIMFILLIFWPKGESGF